MSKEKTETPEEQIIRTDYSEIMQKNYIDYAMSVIVSRALPDIRDGLKPVQRRVLYDMWELGTRSDRPYRKSARIVGDTMGKYHPHGDSSIYDALVVMSQDFKKGQILVDGHGNFGSIEGDGAAAMRYTEARLAPFTEDVFLADLGQDLVDFVPNFDETEKEPEVLPAKVPNVLINGSEGIAVGMATSIPPHNLTEVIDAVEAFIRDDSLTTRDLMQYVKGPDFPTGGAVVNEKDLAEIYETGAGKIRVRGKISVEKGKNGKSSIVISEIPYTMIGSGISKFLNDTAQLVENRVITDISDISNQSSKEGIRIVIELRKGADAENIQNILLKKTKLEDTFGVNMLVVSDGKPETMSLRKLIETHVDFQFEIADRKYQHLLMKELEKKEIQEGLIRATDVIDLIIEILRGSKNRKMAMDCLVMGQTEGIQFKTQKSRKEASKLMFTERQANAILDMRLAKLIGLELEALNADHDETLKKIAKYEELLNSHEAMAEQLIGELETLKNQYGRERRTVIRNAEAVVIEEKAVREEEVVFCLDRFGYVKLLDAGVYEKNKEAADAESRFVVRMMNTDKVLLLTDKGKAHSVKASQIPLKKFREKGVPIDNLSNYTNRDETILWIGSFTEAAASEFFLATGSGLVKRVAGSEFISSVRTVAAANLKGEDVLVFAAPSGDMEFAALHTAGGNVIRFALNEVPVQKKTAAGVRGITIGEEDYVDHAWLLAGGKEFTAEAGGVQIALNRLKLSKRGGKGTRVKGKK